MLRQFTQQGWITAAPHPDDARRKQLALTPAGWAVFEPLQQRSREQVADLLATLAPDQRAQLVAALRTAHGLLAPAQAPTRTAVLREPRPGDMGWVIEQHGALYCWRRFKSDQACRLNFDQGPAPGFLMPGCG